MSKLIDQQPNVAMAINTSPKTQSLINNSNNSETTTPSSEIKNVKLKTGNSLDAVIISLISGAAAGALAKSTIAPLDRAKINFQIDKNKPYRFQAAISFLKKTYINEGFTGLWRGNSATMVRIIPYAAIQFTAHEQWRKILKVDQGGNTKGRRFIAGSLAGITSQSLTYPLDLARARMAVTNKFTAYRTLRETFTSIWIKEGPHALYKGYWATILGVIPYAGTSFFTYETLKKEYHEITGVKTPNAIWNLIFGAIAGLTGQTSSYPLDIVRRRMQTMGINPSTTDQYSTIYSTLKEIYREEGIKAGFFKGLSMNWIKGPIAVGISFSTYDYIKELLRELQQLKRGRSKQIN